MGLVTLGIIVVAAVLAAVAWLPSFRETPADAAQTAETDVRDADEAAGAERADGLPVVNLNVETQRYAGLEIKALQRIRHRPEQPAFAAVLDLQPLLAARAEFEAARAERAVAEANLSASQEAYKRLELLHSENANISAREVQQARSRWRADQIQLEAAAERLRFLRAKTAQRWGPVLTEWAFDAESHPVFERLVTQKSVLAMLSLPAAQSLPAGTERIHVDRNGERAGAKEAFLISPAPMTGADAQGETYFIHADAEGLRTGMRLQAWVPMNKEILTGVRLPASAAVWYAGQPWAYVQVEDELFVRRPITNYEESTDGWFVRSGFEPGEAVVTAGAQLLLGQELRALIPEEDDD